MKYTCLLLARLPRPSLVASCQTPYRPMRISICRCVDRKRVVYVPVILVIGHKASHEIVSTLRKYTRRFSLSRFSRAVLPRTGNASLFGLDNDEGNHNWLLVAIPPTRKIRKLDRQQVYRGSRFLRIQRCN